MQNGMRKNLIFQSTLPRGERLGAEELKSIDNFHFNPRSHEGSDYIPVWRKFVDRISIHAPTRGATALAPVAIGAAAFQSTLPRGERQRTMYDK